MSRHHRRRRPRQGSTATGTIQPGSVVVVGGTDLTVERLLRHKTGGAIVTFERPDTHLINIGYLMSDHQTLLMCTSKLDVSDVFRVFATSDEQVIVDRLIANDAVPLTVVPL